ncbi:PTS system mannose/fructose/N-acetylgalactosamine-transporter subunit IIB [Enterococcus sp. OL5]|uniref:PTS system mannose/fructose/N-acetylgalactosamine-transporter subunit IIB n=1 Tax=Enterococcus sp. OL5 TaxID=2590214 RepID=UPI00112A54CC|nr:PTS sugar transporter subunit IIB [Enterococcus sp. OL5]TPR56870.1 PTS sugar transporter subunit IIB [Enterococcus sp. OL5]
MNDVVEIRVDDRLIHGQVAGLWTNALKATRLMVIDDAVAGDETQKQLLRMVAPASVNTSIITEDKAFANLRDNKYAGQRVFILVKSPTVLKRLVDRGLSISRINLGNLSGRENTDSIRAGIAVTPEEKQALIDLLECNVTVTAIKTPNDPESFVKLEELR